MGNDPDTPALSVVVPLYNEAANVAALGARLGAALDAIGEPCEVLAVDDGSSDGTAALLEEEARRRPGWRVVRLERNRGQHAAILEGFRRARGRAVITLDADLQNPPEEIPRLLAALRAGHDHVATYRVGRRDPLLRRAASGLARAALRALARVAARDLGCMLRGYSAELASALAACGDGRDLFIPLAAARMARNPIEIAVAHAPRAAGASRYGVRKLMALGFTVLKTARRR
jgi:undecaprenyl-phosphate 4-deoxy-4-formamido-L-arabinose transferase